VTMAEGEVAIDYERGAGYVVATWRNALLMMWTDAITKRGLDATERAGKLLEREHGSGVVALSVSLAGVPLPDDEMRAYAARLMRERAHRVALSVTVIEGDGFLLSAGRMVMTALVTLSGGKSKPVIAKSVDEAIAHIHPLVKPRATLAEVTRVMKAFRG